MATNFPTSLDIFTNPTAGNNLSSPSHSGQHANANDAITALETKVGANGSAVTTTTDYKLSGIPAADKATSLTGTETLTNKKLSDTTTFFGAVADLTKRLTVLLSGATTGFTMTLASNHTNNRTVTLPDATTTLTGKDTTDTFTNKRITKREGTETSSATSAINTDNFDIWTITALAVADTIAAPSGTPTQGQPLFIRIKDNGTARALVFNAIFRFSTDLPAPTTTIINKTLYMGFLYNFTDTKWDCLLVTNNF